MLPLNYHQQNLIRRLFTGFRLENNYSDVKCNKTDWEDVQIADFPSSCFDYVHDELATYNAFARPRSNISKPVDVSFYGLIIQILDVNEKEQFMTSTIECG